MIDLHSHILPEIDDGSRNFEETEKMLKEAHEAGFSDIITTSHYMNGVYTIDSNQRKEILKILKDKIDTNVKLYLGAEIYVCPELKEMLEEKIVPTLNESRYVLIELPMSTEITYLTNIIKMIKSMNLVPIIAHPERYKYFQKEPNKMIKYILEGTLFQANYGSILGLYGSAPQKAIKKMLKHNFIHFLGSDAHRQKSIYKKIPEAREKIEKIIGKQKFNELSSKNPSKILENLEIKIENPIKIRKLFG